MTKTLMSGVRIALAISAVSLAASGANGQTAPNAKPVTATVNSALQWGPCPPIFPAGCQIAVLNGDPAKPNADVFLRVPGGYTIPPIPTRRPNASFSSRASSRFVTRAAPQRT